MFIGTLYALAAGLLWGLVFIAPSLLSEYPAPLLSFARYLAFGLDNENAMYDFNLKRTPEDFTPESLRRDGTR